MAILPTSHSPLSTQPPQREDPSAHPVPLLEGNGNTLQIALTALQTISKATEGLTPQLRILSENLERVTAGLRLSLCKGRVDQAPRQSLDERVGNNEDALCILQRQLLQVCFMNLERVTRLMQEAQELISKGLENPSSRLEGEPSSPEGSPDNSPLPPNFLDRRPIRKRQPTFPQGVAE